MNPSFDIGSLPSATKGLESFFRFIVHAIQPKTIVELGSDFGYSLFNFAMPGIGTVYGIDDFNGSFHMGKGHEKKLRIEQNALPNMRLIDRDFRSASVEWGSAIDLLFIDGNHDYDDVRECWEDWISFVPVGGIILFHDTRSYQDGAGRFFRERCAEYPNYEIEHSHGLGVIVKNK